MEEVADTLKLPVFVCSQLFGIGWRNEKIVEFVARRVRCMGVDLEVHHSLLHSESDSESVQKQKLRFTTRDVPKLIRKHFSKTNHINSALQGCRH